MPDDCVLVKAVPPSEALDRDKDIRTFYKGCWGFTKPNFSVCLFIVFKEISYNLMLRVAVQCLHLCIVMVIYLL